MLYKSVLNYDCGLCTSFATQRKYMNLDNNRLRDCVCKKNDHFFLDFEKELEITYVWYCFLLLFMYWCNNDFSELQKSMQMCTWNWMIAKIIFYNIIYIRLVLKFLDSFFCLFVLILLFYTSYNTTPTIVYLWIIYGSLASIYFS